MASKRRQFFKTVLGGLALGVSTSAFPKPAISKGLREWKMVMTWQTLLPGLGTGAVRLAERITTLSEGRLTVKPYGGGELVPPLAVFDAVSNGTAECGHTAPYYWLNKHPASAFFCAVPGGMTNQEQNAWVLFGGGQELWDELYAPFNLKAFPAGGTGTQMGGWFNREINTTADIKGLKMRMPGLAGDVLNRMGGSSQTIPPQELFTAMQSGVIDALEWVGPWNDIALGFHRVSKYYYGPGFHEGGAMLELMVNKEAYEALPDDLKRVVKTASVLENYVMASEYVANNLRAYDILTKDYNVAVKRYPDEVLRALFNTSAEVVADVAEKDAIARKIYESYQRFMSLSAQNGRVTEEAYLNARNQLLRDV